MEKESLEKWEMIKKIHYKEISGQKRSHFPNKTDQVTDHFYFLKDMQRLKI